MHKCIITGGVGREPKIIRNNSGNEFMAFSLASNTRGKNNENKTTWFDIIVPSYLLPRYRKMSDYFKKGTMLTIVGEFDVELDYITLKNSNEKRAIARTTVQVLSIDFAQSNSNNTNKSYDQSAAPASDKELEEAYTGSSNYSQNRNQNTDDMRISRAPQAAPVNNDDDELPF